jgi:gamma-D-glutamyl-L-lysine dipeptidyl-peptidase
MSGTLGERTFARHLAALRADPDDGAEQVTQVLPGEPLAVDERRGDWARVTTEYGYPGWIRAGSLGGEPDPAWLERRADDPVAHARGYLGTVYEWGGMTERGIDCSGLVHMSFRATGRLVPRDADQQEDAGAETGDPQPGDLVTYGDPGKAADHVAFWLGDGRILHATRRVGANGVVEEEEPESLRVRRRKTFRL